MSKNADSEMRSARMGDNKTMGELPEVAGSTEPVKNVKKETPADRR
jgi:hypothetical protein